MWIKLIPVGVILFGVVFLTIAACLKRSRRKYTEQVEAVIVGTVESHCGTHSPGDPVMRMNLPVYEYTYNDTDYKVRGTVSCESPVGTTVTLFVNPSVPDRVYNPADDSSKVITVFSIVGVVLVIAGGMVICGMCYF